jgi:ATP-binding protein involved in chromosome partitioning
MIDNNQVVEILRSVKDPNTGVDIVSARRVKDLKIQGKQIFFALEVNDLPQEAKFAINAECYALLKDRFKDVEVHIHFAMGDGENKTVLPQVKNVIAVASGKGGVGKSTVSVNLAISLSKKGFRVGLMDADLYGPSIPTMMHLQGARPKVQDVYGKPKLIPIEKYGIYLMSIGFIVEPEQAVILRGPRLSGVIKQFVNECIWPELDFLIIDLPPGTGDIQLTLVQSIPITGSIIVTTPQEVAVADAVKASNMFRLDSINIPIVGIVENMAWFTPKELPDNKYFIFGKGGADQLAHKYKTVVLGQVPLIQGIRESGDVGEPSALNDEGPIADIFSNITDQFIKQLNLRHELYEPTRVVRMNK